MATIKVIDNYEIEVDRNMNYEAREFKRMATDKAGKEYPVYRSIGHFSSTNGALNGIRKDMAVAMADEKKVVTIDEWIAIIKECDKKLLTVVY